MSNEDLHEDDLALARACAAGDAAAIARLEREFLSQVPSYVARTATAPHLVDEILQRLRERLLVSKDGTPPKIAAYTGRGPLGAFLRVAAVRIAHDTVPMKRELPRDEAFFADPELDYIKAAYRPRFVAAIERAIASLPARDRNTLALSVIDGLSTDAIGKMYGKDGATVRRWIGAARERVLEETKKLLADELGASGEELESLFGILQSKLDVSIARILEDRRDG